MFQDDYIPPASDVVPVVRLHALLSRLMAGVARNPGQTKKSAGKSALAPCRKHTRQSINSAMCCPCLGADPYNGVMMDQSLSFKITPILFPQVQALQMRRDALANNLKNKQDDLERVEVTNQIFQTLSGDENLHVELLAGNACTDACSSFAG